MKILLSFLLFLGAHFSATALVPSEQKAWIGWPFDKTTKPTLTFLQNTFGTNLTQILSVLAAASFIAALFCLYGKFVPANWWPFLLIIGCVSSILLFLIYFSVWSIFPIIVSLALLYGYISKYWPSII